jgi:hypothetical protein
VSTINFASQTFSNLKVLDYKYPEFWKKDKTTRRDVSATQWVALRLLTCCKTCNQEVGLPSGFRPLISTGFPYPSFLNEIWRHE